MLGTEPKALARALPLSHIPPVRKKFLSQDDPRVSFDYSLYHQALLLLTPRKAREAEKKMVLLLSGHPYVLLDHRTTKAGALVDGYLPNPKQKMTANTQLNEYEIYRLFVNSTVLCRYSRANISQTQRPCKAITV